MSRRSESSIADEEANVFACFLLMPFPMFEQDVDARKLDLTDDAAVAKLARKYRVPIGVVPYRLALGRHATRTRLVKAARAAAEATS